MPEKLGPFELGKVHCVDCLEAMKLLPDGCVDAVVTDPPYGVNLGAHGAANEKRPQFLAKGSYRTYDDTRENFIDAVVPAVSFAVDIADRAAVFCAGTMMWDLPRPDAVGGVYLPAACGRTCWGFSSMAHCLLYGRAPDLNKGAKAIAIKSTDRGESVDHPCPKPISWMVWLVSLVSRDNETVLDPFAGSGTTGVACVQTGRKFLGFEIDQEYCRIANERIAAASKGVTLKEYKQGQEVLFD